MPFKIEHVTVSFWRKKPILVKIIGSNQKLYGAIQMLRAHSKGSHLRVLAGKKVPSGAASLAQDWVDKIDTIDITIDDKGMVHFDGERPVSDYYRILPV